MAGTSTASTRVTMRMPLGRSPACAPGASGQVYPSGRMYGLHPKKSWIFRTSQGLSSCSAGISLVLDPPNAGSATAMQSKQVLIIRTA